jgi:hypothetical protein
LKVLKRGVCGLWQSQDDQITIVCHKHMLIDNVPQASLYQISNMGIAHIFGHCETDTAGRTGILSDQNHEAPFRALSNTLNACKFVAFFDSPT